MKDHKTWNLKYAWKNLQHLKNKFFKNLKSLQDAIGEIYFVGWGKGSRVDLERDAFLFFFF